MTDFSWSWKGFIEFLEWFVKQSKETQDGFIRGLKYRNNVEEKAKP